jgi:hypothetical protein
MNSADSCAVNRSKHDQSMLLTSFGDSAEGAGGGDVECQRAVVDRRSRWLCGRRVARHDCAASRTGRAAKIRGSQPRSSRRNARLAHTSACWNFNAQKTCSAPADSAAGVAHLAAMLRRDPSNHIAAVVWFPRWSTETGRCHPLCPCGTGTRLDCFLQPGRLHVLSASRDKTAQLRNAVTENCWPQFITATPLFWRATIAEIVCMLADGTARIWNGMNGAPITPELRHKGKSLLG